MNYQQQQQQGYGGGGGGFQQSNQSSYTSNYPSNPSYRPPQQQSQQFNPSSNTSIQSQTRPPYWPTAGAPSTGYTPLQPQQQQAAMLMAAQARQVQSQSGSAGQGSGMMGPPQNIPGLSGVAGFQGLSKDQQQQAINMMQAQQAAIQQQNGGQPSLSMGGSGAGPSTKKRRSKVPPLPAQQMIPRQPAPPRHTEVYRQAAMSGPQEAEPWADALDEVDPRELAMGRFRSRQEALSEIFSPDPIKSILAVKYDPWAGLGMDAVSLEDKVAQLEKENEILSERMDTDVESFSRKLAEAEGVQTESIAVPA